MNKRKITKVSFSLLRNMKKANDDNLILLDIFDLEKQKEEHGIIFLSSSAIFIRDDEYLNIFPYQNDFKLPINQQYIFFSRSNSAFLKEEIKILFKTFSIIYLDVDYNELNHIEMLLNLPYEVTNGFVGDFGCN